jgi:hypothetical protein
MAGPRKRRPVHCQGWHEDERCDGVATWRNDWTQGAGWHEPEPGYLCDKCGWAAGEKLIAELDLQYVDDGRIRGPEDVGPRLLGALDSAARDGRLSARDRAIHAVCCQRAMELNYVEIMAGSEWLAQEAGARLGRSISKTKARASRVRLENLGYLRRLTVSNITSHSLKAAVEGRKTQGLRPVTLLEVRKAPAWPTCAYCDGPIPDIQRVSKRYCSDRCRKAHGRTDPGVEAKLEEVFAELRAAAA